MAESWRMFMAEETSQPITQRWEWHAWHFFLALLPAYGKLNSASTRPHLIESRPRGA